MTQQQPDVPEPEYDAFDPTSTQAFDRNKLVVLLTLLALLFVGILSPLGDETAVRTEIADLPPPALTVPDSGTIAPGPVTLSGVAEPGSTVRITVDDQPVGTATADDSGNWILDTTLPEGRRTVEVAALDDSGNVISSSEPVPIVVGAPDTAVATEPSGSEAAEGTVEPAEGTEEGTGAAATPAEDATAPVGEEVTAEAEATTAPADEATSAAETDATEEAATTPENAEAVTETAVATLAAGQVPAEATPAPGEATSAAEATTPAETTVPTEATTAAETTAPTATTAPPEATAETEATTPAEATAEATAETEATTPAEATAEATAETEATTPAEATAEATTTAAEETPAAAETASAEEAPTLAPAPTVTLLPTATPAPETDATPTAETPPTAETTPPAEAEATDEAEAAATPESAPPTLSVPESGAPRFNPFTGQFVLEGTAEPSTSVGLVVDDEIVGTATADENGNWSIEANLDDGAYDVSVTTLDESGGIVAESAVTAVTIPTAPPSLDVSDYVRPDAGVTLPQTETGEPKFNVPGQDFSWTGLGTRGTRVEIVANGEVIGTVAVNNDGTWNLDTDLPAGTYQLQLRELDAQDRVTAETPPVTVEVVDQAPPTLQLSSDEEAAAPPTFSGTAPPGTTVELVVNGEPLASATAGDDGMWSITMELPDGRNYVQVRTLDEDGNVQLLSPVRPYTGGQPTGDVSDVTTAAGSFETFGVALDTSGIIARLAGHGPFTIFAPTDAAFDALPGGTVEAFLSNPNALNDLLKQHIVKGVYRIQDLIAAGSVPTLAGGTLPVTLEGDTVYVAGVPILDEDMLGSAVAVHAIDGVLMPPLPPGTAMPVIDESGVPTFTGRYLTVVGTAAPGKTIRLLVNGEDFGQPAHSGRSGYWMISDDIGPGKHEIVAYMYSRSGILLAISEPVYLPVP